MRRANSILFPSITDERERRRYVAFATAGTIAVALGVDVANQLLFFESWAVCLRNWTITVVVAGALTFVVAGAIARVQLELYRAKTHADLLSCTDPLTGLPNRRALMEFVEAVGVESMALVIADIDRFKRVNDRHGHLVGDAVIRTVAAWMREELSGLGGVVRIGGEEFALLSPLRDPGQLEAALERCRARVAATPILAHGATVRVSISAGVALAGPGQRFEDIYAAADRALYLAKTSGRNRILFASDVAALDEAASRAGAPRAAARA